jgi:hypothetical protein
MHSWLFINILAFVGTPAGLLDGWICYGKMRERSIRTKFSLTALAFASASVVLLIASILARRLAGWHTTDPSARFCIQLGVSTAIAGAATSFVGRLRLIFSSLIANTGAVMLWFGLTQR